MNARVFNLLHDQKPCGTSDSVDNRAIYRNVSPVLAWTKSNYCIWTSWFLPVLAGKKLQKLGFGSFCHCPGKNSFLPAQIVFWWQKPNPGYISGLYLSVGSRVKYPPIIEKDPTILEVTKKKFKKNIIFFFFF